MKRLPPTGTAALLQALSPYIPDSLINSLFAERAGPGRRALFSAAQLFRVHLLALLTPAHSFNLLVPLLAEHRTWRCFARLRNRRILPDVRMLHEFRQRLDLTKLRRINEHLLAPLLKGCASSAKTVALIDATDLPAATNAYKKTPWASTALTGRTPGRGVAKKGRVVISSVTKNTRCGSGCANIVRAFCWRRWFRGPPRPIGMIRCFWSPAFTIARGAWSGPRTLWSATWLMSICRPSVVCAKTGTWRW